MINVYIEFYGILLNRLYGIGGYTISAFSKLPLPLALTQFTLTCILIVNTEFPKLPFYRFYVILEKTNRLTDRNLTQMDFGHYSCIPA